MTTALYRDERCLWHGGRNYAFTLPVGEFEELPEDWYVRLYDGLFAATVVMVGLIAATVTVLYRTARRVIARMTPSEDI